MGIKRTAKRSTRRDGVIALDRVRPGTDNLEEQPKLLRVNKTLPDEVDSAMLYKDVFKIAWPSFTELILTQVVSMIDMIMVGSLGAWAIAAVGLTNQPKFLFMIMFMAMNVGATALVARYRGAQDARRANIVLRQAFFLAFILSAFTAILGFIFAEHMIRFMGAEGEQTLTQGAAYLRIQMVGLPVLAMTSVITASLRGIGDARTAMAYNLVANAVNVLFNWLLIFGNLGFPRLGVIGASYATVIAQCTALVLALNVVVRGRRYLRLNFKEKFKIRPTYLKRIANIGFPSMFEQSIMRAGMIMYTLTVTALGDVAYATHQICISILGMSFMVGQSFGVSATSLTGQSLGKKRPDMAQAYTIRTRRLGLLLSFFVGICFFLFGSMLIGLYTDEREIMEQGKQILKIMAFVIPFQTSQLILAGALRGAGDTRATAVISLITILIIRPSFSFVATNFLHLGLMGAWYALAIDQVLRSLLVLIRYMSGKWKVLKV